MGYALGLHFWAMPGRAFTQPGLCEKAEGKGAQGWGPYSFSLCHPLLKFWGAEHQEGLQEPVSMGENSPSLESKI